MTRWALVAVVCVCAVSGPAAIDEPTVAALEYVGEESSTVAYANVRALLASPLGDRLRQLTDAHPALNRLEGWTGISLERDVDAILFATRDTPAAAAGCQPPAASCPLLVLGGRLGSRQIEAYAQDRGGETEPYRGVTVVRAPRQIGDIAVGLPGPGLALVGDAASVHRALDAKMGAVRAITDNVGFMTATTGLDGSAAWTITTFQAATARTTIPAEIAAQLPPIDWIGMSGRFGTAPRGEILAVTPDEMSATSLREIMRGFIALAKMQSARNRDLRGTLDTMTLGGEGTIVSVTMDLTPAMMARIETMGVWRLALPWLP